jgi:hypothetical protein
MRGSAASAARSVLHVRITLPVTRPTQPAPSGVGFSSPSPLGEGEDEPSPPPSRGRAGVEVNLLRPIFSTLAAREKVELASYPYCPP